MKIIYHGIDLDGKASGAILHQRFSNAELVGIDHGQVYDFNNIKENEEVYIVDFTFKPADMIKLKEICGDNLFWIDHHKTAIENSYEFKYSDIPGIREIGIGACELVWKALHGSMPPYSIYLLGKYDIFQLDLDKNILPFQFGMRGLDHAPDDEIWDKLLTNTDGIQTTMLIQEIIRNGEAILNYENKLNARIAKSMSFEIKFEGLNALCVNRSHINSKFLDSVYDNQDILLIFSRGRDLWKVTLYGKKDSIDVSKIAKKYGGGGHEKAAGFTTNNIDFLFSPKLYEE